METLLVTGGAGFIGCNFVRLALARTDACVVVVDKLTYAGNLRSLDGIVLAPRVAFVHADIGDAAAMRTVFRTHRPTAVVNFAAETHVDRSIDSARPFIDTNVRGTQVLLEASRQCGIGRFLHVSTDEVYGSLGPTGAFTEETPLAPSSP